MRQDFAGEGEVPIVRTASRGGRRLGVEGEVPQIFSARASDAGAPAIGNSVRQRTTRTEVPIIVL
ncbi:MAG TPA: hypothetical protein VGR26_18875 [Acidimicrobiales bacterium]|nr:hypothetical protein [Acidimicrobiales bacterium]